MNEEKKKSPLPEQQRAIESIKNTVVAAGAGSGKTTVLSQRFLNLVKKFNYSVDEILTLTFTKKATVEMSERIYKVLKNEAPEQAALFYKANIKTLDSYCNSVAKLGSRFYGISPDFTQDEKKVFAQVREKALPFILEHRENPAIKHFVKIQDYEQIAEDLFVEPILKKSKIAEPIDFYGDLEKQYKKIEIEWKKTVQSIHELLEEAERFEDEFEGNRETNFFQAYLKIKNSTEIPEAIFISAQQLKDKNYQDEISDRNFTLEKYVFNLTQFKYPKAGNTKGGKEFSCLVDELRKNLSYLISLFNYIYGIPFVNELIPLLQEFQQIVMETKRSLNCLTFSDISNMALCILREHPEIRLLEKKKYKAIMIDEFQDNNKDQRDMLFLLAEKIERQEKGVPSIAEILPDKLFFVGDEKQSIYKFRGADVEVFNNLTKDFQDGKLEMATNHRSHPELIAAFNTIFGGEKYSLNNAKCSENLPSVFYKETQTNVEIPSYEAIYHNVCIPDYKDKTIKEKRIHLAFFEKDEEQEENSLFKESAEAQWVALKIKEKIENGINPSDIVILMNTYSHQAVFERTFLAHGIPYNTENIKGFFSDGPVCDITSYLRLCTYPKDRLAYAQVLRSPFVNLSLQESEAVLSQNLEPFANESENLLEEDSLLRFRQASIFFERVKNFSKENSLAKTISLLWYEGGYRFETMWNKSVENYGKLYDLLFELSRQADEANLNLASFVDSLDSYSEENSSLEINIPLEKSDGVHIMSIHKSKGLEFKIVFVCNTQNSKGYLKNDMPIYLSRDFGITVNSPLCKTFSDSAKNFFFEYAKEENYAMQSAEMRRLTYVALTRAIDEVFITNGKYSKKGWDKSHKYLPGNEGKILSIYDCLSPIVDFYQEDENKAFSPFTEIEYIPQYPRNEIFIESGRKNISSEKTKFVKELRNENPYENSQLLKKEIVEKIHLSPSKLYKEEEFEENTNDIKNLPYAQINEIVESQRHKNFGYNDFGTIAHAYMESAINKTEDKIPYSNKDITHLDGNREDLLIIEKVCIKMKEEFKNSQIGKKAINSVWHRAEESFRSRIGDKIINGTIDLVFKDKNDDFVIVDYKTNQNIQPEIYYLQLALYAQAVSQMYGVQPEKIRCFLYYLRFAKEIEITEECRKIDLNATIEKYLYENNEE
ncbi:UvrD-helicase domain-containing protein [Treponema pectinovorum]|uniref:UvrD-helicase domain-containing protein n=1 Tax=Treponema pectinovorum TaxID=164 RepID=UPI003D8CD541